MLLLFGIGGFEIALIFFVALLLFGSKQLPEIARIMGKSWKEIKKATNEVSDEFKTQTEIFEKETKKTYEDLNNKKENE